MGKQKRLLFISQYFFPETFRGNDIAFYMANKGIDVTVICGTPNYPKGKFFKGYGWFSKTHEKINGVRIIRVPIIPRGQGNKIKLLLNYFSYFLVASIFLPFHLLTQRRYDACFVQQLSPVMMSVPGVMFKKITGRKLCTWVLDLWPESLKAAGGIQNKHILKFFEWFSILEYKNSDVICVSSESFKKNIKAKGDFSSKIQFMPNWADDAIIADEKKEIPQLPNGFKVLFAGNIGEAQDFDNILETVKLIGPSENIHFVIIGDGRKKEWTERQISLHNLSDRITLLGRFDIKYMPSFFKYADCLLLPLKDDEIMNLTVPAKLQAYMNAGRPIVGMINGDAQELINNIGCGIAVPSSSPKKLVDAIRKLKGMSDEDRSLMGMRGKEYCDNNYNRETILQGLFDTVFSN